MLLIPIFEKYKNVITYSEAPRTSQHERHRKQRGKSATPQMYQQKMHRIGYNEVVGIMGRSDNTAGRRAMNVMRAGGWGDGGKGQDEGLQHSGLQAAKGGLEVGLGSIDRGGSCWW